MTRCIHCTRCVRFGQEIAGIQELGTTGRGEHMEIGTYIEHSVDHELSGNIIDLCPVGALNSKPYRFGARAWEMLAKPLIAPHDCVGSNLDAHVLRGTLKRVVPRDNEAINETWISDRDRFSYEGIYADDRLLEPMIKRDQEWVTVSWDEGLDAAAAAFRAGAEDGGDALGAFVSPSATVEEQYLLTCLVENCGSSNIDYRLRTRDFRDQEADPPWRWLGADIAALEDFDSILVIGSNLRMEVPMLAHRIRKAALKGAAIGFVNPERYEYHFPVAAHVDAPVESFAAALAGVVAAAGGNITGVSPDADQEAVAGAVDRDGRSLVLLGQLVERHPCAADIRALAAELCRVTGAQLGYLSDGANAAGAAIAGATPHRGPGAVSRENSGRHVNAMLSSPRHVYVLYGVEPDADFADAELTQQALKSADSVVCFTAYATESLMDCADVLLPIATFAETSGTYVNAEGRWQSFAAAARQPGEAREGWRVLRVLGNLLNVPDCAYRSADDILEALRVIVGDAAPDNAYSGGWEIDLDEADVALDVLDVPIYGVDAIVRRATSLQHTRLAAARDSAHPADRVA
jgi:NADH-quinone oxidoreductase subunit G